MFGEARVRELVSAQAHPRMADLAAALLAAVKAFAGDTPQQDDVTLVLLRRDSAAG